MISAKTSDWNVSSTTTITLRSGENEYFGASSIAYSIAAADRSRLGAAKPMDVSSSADWTMITIAATGRATLTNRAGASIAAARTISQIGVSTRPFGQ